MYIKHETRFMKFLTRFPLNISHINALTISFFFIWSLAEYLVRSASHGEPQKCQSWRTSEVPVIKYLRSASHGESQKCQSWRTSLSNLQFSSYPALPRPNNLPQSHSQTQIMSVLHLTPFFNQDTRIVSILEYICALVTRRSATLH